MLVNFLPLAQSQFRSHRSGLIRVFRGKRTLIFQYLLICLLCYPSSTLSHLLWWHWDWSGPDMETQLLCQTLSFQPPLQLRVSTWYTCVQREVKRKSVSFFYEKIVV